MQICLEIGKGTDNSSHLHKDRYYNRSEMNEPPSCQVEIEEYGESQYDKYNPEKMDKDCKMAGNREKHADRFPTLCRRKAPVVMNSFFAASGKIPELHFSLDFPL